MMLTGKWVSAFPQSQYEHGFPDSDCSLFITSALRLRCESVKKKQKQEVLSVTAAGADQSSGPVDCVFLLLSDVKQSHRRSETKRYSEIFREFDSLELSLV